MKKPIKPVLSISVLILLLIGIFTFNCRFSFAEAEKPEKGSITFGASSKPVVKTSPQFDAFKNVFADIAEQVIPTVVSITSTKIDTVIYNDPFYQFFWGTPFEDFFNTPRRRPNQQQQPEPRSDLRRSTGAGSGVIVSKEGYILTNYHVVGDADEIIVEMYNEREYEAEIVGIDSLSDVAVIKLKENVPDLPVAYLGDSEKLRPGDWVMAIGNPFALSSTVTTGIVSALGRQTGMAVYKNYIQTDAAINPGNSGGALINIEGDLIGINTMIYTRSGGYMGIGFAIPINMAKNIMEQLIYKGEVSRGWLGVGIGDIDQNMKEALGLDSRNGVLINDVFKGQPAQKAGIKVGDVITSINGLKTNNANALKNTVASITPGEKVPVEIIRDGKKITLHVKLINRDEKEISRMSSGPTEKGGSEEKEETDVSKKLGFAVGSITDELREQLQLKSGVKGVIVTSVDQSSKAARKGLQQNDIIKKIKIKNNNIVVVDNVKSFKKATGSIKTDDSVLLYVERGGNSFFIAFKSN
ncbi:MAG: Do family serine endopeptidase [Chitinispirillia bacterium]|jgi:serine protease Do